MPTNPKIRCLGVQRELQNSPGREMDDILILRAVLEKLETSGIEIRLVNPEELDALDPASWDVVLPMCESYPRLKRLIGIARRQKSIFINTPNSVLNCYRARMVPLLEGSSHFDFPPSEIRRVKDGLGAPSQSFTSSPHGWWIKRGDVHNTCDRDVVRVYQWAEAERVLANFQSREITHFIIQPHIAGDLIKFYGVGPGKWFNWFYHDSSSVQRFPFKAEALATAASAAATPVGLEIFGGDAIITPDGTITLIDINSWPSFARVLPEASTQIADHVMDRFFAGISK